MGRPRSIPEKDALERALRLFWEKGYNRTSITDLSESIGVGPSSIYNAFGSKLEIFHKSIDQYMQTHVAFVGELFGRSAEMDANAFVGELLNSLVMLYTDETTPLGCAMMQGGGSGGAEDSPACAITVGMKTSLESALRDLFESMQTKGEHLNAPPHILAKFVIGTIRGLSQLACDGTNRDDLLAVAAHAAKSCTA